MQRISVIGTSGSGKTTLARRISEILVIPYIELDALLWKSNWTQVPNDVMRDRISHALACNSWVVDGNCSRSENARFSVTASNTRMVIESESIAGV